MDTDPRDPDERPLRKGSGCEGRTPDRGPRRGARFLLSCYELVNGVLAVMVGISARSNEWKSVRLVGPNSDSTNEFEKTMLRHSRYRRALRVSDALSPWVTGDVGSRSSGRGRASG